MNVRIESRTINTYRDFMKTLQTILYSTWGKDKVMFVSAYPKVSDSKNLKTPIITYQIMKKLPGAFGNTAERKPRLREEIPISKIDDQPIPDGTKSMQVWGQMFDYWIQFDIWAETGEEADETVEKFQEFMFKYTGYLKKAGVSEILFEDMTTNESTNKWRSDLVNRTITYHVRLDEIVGVKCPAIEDIFLDTWLYGLIIYHKDIVLASKDILVNDDDEV